MPKTEWHHIQRETWELIRASAQARHGRGMPTDQRYHEAMNEWAHVILRDIVRGAQSTVDGMIHVGADVVTVEDLQRLFALREQNGPRPAGNEGEG